MNVLAAIPARFASRRFPGKALVNVGGIPLVARVVRAVLAADVADRVVLATDDQRIADAVQGLAVEVVLSQGAYRCGTDRVAAAVAGMDHDIVINVQGDEPLVGRPILMAAVGALTRGAERDLGTAAAPVDAAELSQRNCVKVRVDRYGCASWFGRLAAGQTGLWQHIGVYAFWRESLRRFTALAPSLAEREAGLEQLRAMSAGMKIGVGFVERAGVSVNCPADVERVEQYCRRDPDEMDRARWSVSR